MLRITPQMAFNELQIVTYDNLSNDLQSCIQSLFCCLDDEDGAQVAKNIIDFQQLTVSTSLKEKELFLKSLLSKKTDDLLDLAGKLIKICKSDWEKAFWCCLTTKKRLYFSQDVLRQVITAFDGFISTTIKPLNTFPSFETGGEVLLSHLKSHPEKFQTTIPDAAIHSIHPSQYHFSSIPSRATLFSNKSGVINLKKEVVRYLTSLPETHRLKMDVYLSLFREIQDNQDYSDLSKTYLIKLTILLTTKDNKAIKTVSADQLLRLVDEIALLQTYLGEEVFFDIVESALKHNEFSLITFLSAVQSLNKVSDRLDLMSEFNHWIEALRNGQLSLNHFLENLETQMPSDQSLILQPENLDHLMHRFAGNDSTVLFPISPNYLEKIKYNYVIVQNLCIKWKDLSLEELIPKASIFSEKSKTVALNENEILELLAIGRLAIYQHTHQYLYNTQILTILAKLCYKNGAVSQVKTGQGKSNIVKLLAFILAMQHKNLHIISSSQNLAIRDQQASLPFFNLFEITTSNICAQNPSAKSFKANILYGTKTDYQFALMRELVYSTPLFEETTKVAGQKKFENTVAIVDELDNLTIDTADHGARLSLPVEISHIHLFRPIFSFVAINFTKNDFNTLLQLTTIPKLKTHLKTKLGTTEENLIDSISNEQYKAWLTSAFGALFQYVEKIDYVYLSNNGESSEIVIVDADNTGRLMHGMQWGNGLHAMIEIKHGLDPTKETLTPIAIYNSNFYPLYGCLYGTTGTLGSKDIREEIKALYGVDSFDVPTYRPCMRIDQPIRIFRTRLEKLTAMSDSVSHKRLQGRCNLILFTTIKETEQFELILKNRNIPCELLNEIQKKSEEEILALAGHSGATTVATNTAARGTDIILENACVSKGGLDVNMGFFATSLRVEDQGRGRAGRQSQPGSSQVMTSLEDLGLDLSLDINNTAVHDSIVNDLQTQRQNRDKMDKVAHIIRFDFDSYCYSFVNLFYATLTLFNQTVSDKNFLYQKSILLTNRRLLKDKIISAQLSKKDQDIAKQCVRLFRKETKPLEWEVLLTEAKDVLKTKVLQRWSQGFYFKMNDMQKKAGADCQMRINTINNLSQLMNFQANTLYNQFELAMAAQNAALKPQVAQMYATHKNDWEKYMTPSGGGLIDYIREITGMVLEDI